MMTSWFSFLDSAKSLQEVVSVARDFMATLTPADLALLPEACRPGRLRDAQDIEALHATLVEEYRGTRVTGDRLDVLQRLTSFVVRASIRIAELGGDSSETAGGPKAEPKRLAPRREG